MLHGPQTVSEVKQELVRVIRISNDRECELIASLREILGICRQWEPDCASGKDRNTLARAQSLLPPNVRNEAPSRPHREGRLD